MAVPASPLALSLDDIQNEFGGPNSPISFADYYRGGSYVPSSVLTVPTSGSPISMSSFRGLSKRIIVTVSNTRIDQNTASLFTNPPGYPSGSYWGQSIEKELIITGSISATNRSIAALTISSGGSGAFFLTNQGFISGGGGSNATIGRDGGTALEVRYSTTINNTGTIRGGGGRGIPGRTGGRGGNGGNGVIITSSKDSFSWVEVDRRYGGNNYIRLTTRTDIGRLVYMKIVYRGNTIYERDVTLGGTLASLPYRVGDRRYNTGAFQKRTDNFIFVKGNRTRIGYTDEYQIVVQDRITTTTYTYGTVSGCLGSLGSVGGGGGFGRGSDYTGTLSGGGVVGATGRNFCSNYPTGGYGGGGGRGGSGSSGGDWGQAGSSAIFPDNNPSGASSGEQGGTGGGLGPTYQPGSAGTGPTAGANTIPGAAGYAVLRSGGAAVTYVNTGTRQGLIN